jgi:hypothetical protein
MIAVGKGADVGDGKKATRKRATGTREHVVTYLAESGALQDKDGLASNRLAAAVGYPGSSVAFAQLLSGMERSGLIKREVRGKRTYRITLGDVAGFGPVRRARAVEQVAAAQGLAEAVAPGGGAERGGAERGGPERGGDFDYDELARRLLIQVVRRLAASEPEADLRQPDPPALGETVSDLEHELASAWTKHGRLAEENIRLREQLRTAQQSLAQARDRVRKLPITSDLDSAEVVLLQRLLSPDSEDAEARGRGRERGRGIIAGR